MGKEGEFRSVGHDVKDVAVVVECVEAVGVGSENFLEESCGRVEVFAVVMEEGEFCLKEGACWEGFGI
jgi:hypothetical protein